MSQEAKLTGVESIPSVIEAMTLEEKARLVVGAKAFETWPVERLGIPAVVPLDGHNGITMHQLVTNLADRVLARQEMASAGLGILFSLYTTLGTDGLDALLAGTLDPERIESLPPEQATFVQDLGQEIEAFLPPEGLPTCFPPGIVMGATWNPALVGECGAAVAKEARAYSVDMLLGPNVNIHRNPLGGRVFESYSEDPYLASQIVVDYVRGVQGEGVAADVKHFAANSQETHRHGINEIIPERALREIYFPAFRAAIQEGGCWTVMSAYNKINGHDCAMNRWLLTEVLREEWGFTGMVVSDWGAAYDRVEALLAGNDLEMPGPQDPQVILDAVVQGVLPEAVLDERIANILGVWVKLPAFQGKERPALDRALSSRLARAIAVEGAVLLKNRNGALPFSSETIAVLGENAIHPLPTGGGSAGVTSPYVVSLLEGLEARFSQDRVHYGAIPVEAGAAIVSAGVHSREGADRTSLRLAEADVALIHDTARTCRERGIKLVVVLNVCGPVEVAEWIDEVDAVLLIWLGGMELGHAAAALLAGDENPSGKLPLTFPQRYQDVPSYLNFPGESGAVWYGEGIFVGYRYYDAVDIQPQFPFGHGLSYTSFALSNLRLSAEALDVDRDETLQVSVDVTNTGDRPGQEVVQLYLSDVQSTLHKPPKELKGFRKVALAPGETQTVELTLDRRALAHWDPAEHAWCVEPGVFQVLVGVSSDDIRLKGEFTALGLNPYRYGPRTAIGQVMGDPRARDVLVNALRTEGGTLPARLTSFVLAPQFPLQTVLPRMLAEALPSKSEAQRAEVEQRIYEALGEIEV